MSRNFLKSLSIVAFLLSFVTIKELKSQDIAFTVNDLDLNGQVNVGLSTYLKFGPDGRLYITELSGTIFALTIHESANGSYTVMDSEIIELVSSIPNHNDDGSANGGQTREVTALYVVGTAQNPVIYVSSSDPRIGGPSGDKNLDTNSGIITRLTWTGTTWDVIDLVRGLPRSEENHATHGLEFAEINGKPYLLACQGGHTNAGSPSTNFAWLTEYALSAAVLAIDLDQLDALPVLIDNESGRKYVYDLPTLDDPTRPNINGIANPNNSNYDGVDVNDPWGGNDGLNQAKLVENGPVQILTAGYRNTYDMVVTTSGALYVTDNGGNNGWGGFPESEGLDGTVTNNYRIGEPGSLANTFDNGEKSIDNKDHLTLVTQDIGTYTFGSFYGGHPNPVRANPNGAGLFTRGTHSSDPDDVNGNGFTDDWFRKQILSPSNPNFATKSLPVDWPPVPLSLADVREGDMRVPSSSSIDVDGDFKGNGYTNPDGPGDDNVLVWNNNTNGIYEYTASNFGGAMQGNLIAGKSGGFLHRLELNTDGTVSTFHANWVQGLGGNALGIWCSGDNDPFPGTIWVATFNQTIKILVPDEEVNCILPGDAGYDPLADNDNDGFTNEDETQNGTDLCSGASQPNDFDGDKLSDLID
ncbi:MAG: ring canal kelch-like protein, partial [Bacteroidota bacterium]